MKRLDIAIIGAGTAGSASAILLGRQGHRVTVFERVPKPGPVGAGITLQPSGLSVLGRMGLEEKIRARGARIDSLDCRTGSEKVVCAIDYKSISLDAHGLGVHRGVLFEALYGEAGLTPGVRILAGVEVTRIVRRRFVEDSEGNVHGPFDLLCVADGGHSHLDKTSHFSRYVSKYPWGALWFVAKDHERRFGSVLTQRVDGARRMFGILPTGLGPDPSNQVPLLSFFYSLPVDGLAAWRERGIAAWRDEARAISPLCEPVLDQIDSLDEVLFSTYVDVSMHPWHASNVVVLGDAAHATSPQLGQGCNLALVDAFVLGQMIETHEDVPAALDSYSRARKEHLAYYQWATRFLTPFFQSSVSEAGLLRDIGMPLLLRLPLARRIMERSMAGFATGLFGSLKHR